MENRCVDIVLRIDCETYPNFLGLIGSFYYYNSTNTVFFHVLSNGVPSYLLDPLSDYTNIYITEASHLTIPNCDSIEMDTALWSVFLSNVYKLNHNILIYMDPRTIFVKNLLTYIDSIIEESSIDTFQNFLTLKNNYKDEKLLFRPSTFSFFYKSGSLLSPKENEQSLHTNLSTKTDSLTKQKNFLMEKVESGAIVYDLTNSTVTNPEQLIDYAGLVRYRQGVGKSLYRRFTSSITQYRWPKDMFPPSYIDSLLFQEWLMWSLGYKL